MNRYCLYYRDFVTEGFCNDCVIKCFHAKGKQEDYLAIKVKIEK